jgi:sirohydrochlorin ferrochelatase
VEERIRAILPVTAGKHSELPAVALVDHGSPEPKVTAVRNRVAAQLARRFGPAVRGVAACSMERREEPEFAFNDPLLAALLDTPPYAAGAVIVAPLFLSPGRHAGPAGDIAQICRDAEARHPGLHTAITSLVGDHPAVIEILGERLAASLQSLARG